MKRRIVISGVGVISPIGNTKESFWQSLICGKSGVDKLTCFDSSRFTCHIAAEVRDFDPHKYFNTKEVKHLDRFVQFAVHTADMAVKDSGLDFEKEDRFRCGVLIGSGMGGLHTIESQYNNYVIKGPERISPFLIPMLIINIASGHVSIRHGLKGPNFSIATACASANHAIGEAFKVIQRGDADIMVAGGTEASITQLGFGGFCALKALSLRNDDPKRASRPFDKNRDGFVMAEGAGLIILEELSHAQKRNAPIYAEIIGYGASADAYHITAPDSDGSGAAYCMASALNDAGIKNKDVSYINAHGTSTQLNDKVETIAIKKVFDGYAKKIPVSSIKSMIGHTLGAAAGIEAIATALTIKEGIIPPTTNYETPDPECDLDYVPNEARHANVDIAISNSLGFGGHNATIVLKKFS